MTREIFFFKHHAQNEPRKLVPDPSLFYKKAQNEVKPGDLGLNFNILIALNLAQNKNKLYKSLIY